MTTDRPRSFSDLRKPTIKIAQLVGEPVMIDSFSLKNGRYGEMATVDIYREHTKTDMTLITGASTFIDRLKAAEVHRLLPMNGMVIKESGDMDYYDIVNVDSNHPQYTNTPNPDPVERGTDPADEPARTTKGAKD